jgi:hypothetical protein
LNEILTSALDNASCPQTDHNLGALFNQLDPDVIPLIDALVKTHKVTVIKYLRAKLNISLTAAKRLLDAREMKRNLQEFNFNH